MASIIAGAVIPELLRICVLQQGRGRATNFMNLLFGAPFWCFMGVSVDFFYRCQAGWFGAAVTFPVVAKKVVVDQFLYNPLFGLALSMWVMLYTWMSEQRAR